MWGRGLRRWGGGKVSCLRIGGGGGGGAGGKELKFLV